MTAPTVLAAPATGLDGLALQCPRCRALLTASQHCPRCGFSLDVKNGILVALPPERAERFACFITDYERIRAAEGRGSLDPAYYLNLPYTDRSGSLAAQWRIRARTFRALSRHVSLVLAPGARILDLGAGNGWMSYRLAQCGFRPAAIDLLVNDSDGLGAAQFYRDQVPAMFPRFQAELTHLPFASGQFDAAVFNASFHYAEGYAETLGEALRCLKPGGLLLIADTPWYAHESSGARMLVERQTSFQSRFGTSSDSIPSLEFLTPERLVALERAFGIRWAVHTPWYGVRWALRPVVARLLRRRPPSRFRIFSTRKPA